MNTKELKERIEKLSPKQKALLAMQFKAQYLTSGTLNGHSAQRLVAYVIDDGNVGPSDFRDHLKGRLPEYMVPAAFVQLDEFPRLPNGKVNNHALPNPGEAAELSETDYTAPRTDTEKKLAAIWGEVLNFDPVGIHDNFFEIGGDSILSIQIIAKANKAGLGLKPNSIFEHQTIAGLALSVGSGAEKTVSNETVTGEVPMLPIQHWFFEEHRQAPHHWNQGLVFENTTDLSAGLLQKAMEHLTTHHDALRQEFVKDAGKWKTIIGEPLSKKVFQKFDLGKLSVAEQETSIKEKTKLVQGGLSLSEGPLFQGVYFDCGKKQPDKFLLFAHHLLVDAVSWGILVGDLKTIYQQLKTETKVLLPPKTASYKDWGTHLLRLANTGQINGEKEFWHRQSQGVTSLPRDFETAMPVTEEGIATINFELDKDTTQKLRSEALNIYNTKMDEFLLAVLTEVIGDWAGATSICLGLERHGRETMDSGLDLSNTVGWCTSFYPVSLDYNSGTGPGTMLKTVKEQLRKVPNGGIGYGILKYLHGDEGGKMELSHPHPPVIFNYLGNLSPFNAGDLGIGVELKEGNRHPESERYHMLEINTFIQGGQLKVRWGYSRKLHLPDSIQKLSEAFEKTLKNFITHCSKPDAGGFTPSDFPEAGLNQDDLDNLLGEIDL